jgi:hypothetical protein
VLLKKKKHELLFYDVFQMPKAVEMKCLRRNEDAMKYLSWYQKKAAPN